MALKTIVGDVFSEITKQPNLFVHGCNCQGVFGSGIAAIVKKLYPEAYKAYKTSQKEHGLIVGNVSWHHYEDTGLIIANALTQQTYGRDKNVVYVSYDALVDSMQEVARVAKEMDLPVFLPFIGGGLGNGDKYRLTSIFEAVYHDVDATLVLKEE